MELFDVSIDTLSRNSLIKCVGTFLDEKKFHRIATVNPEFLLRAEKDEAFRENLRVADLRIADGFGIVLAGWLQGKKIERFPGADLMEEILRMANDRHLSIFCAVRKDGLSSFEEVRSVILKKYPNARISGADIFCHSERVLESRNLNPTTREIPRQARDDTVGNSAIIFCNFGAPDQEYFLESFRVNPGEARLAMGVGGAFDYLTGKQKRAPKFLRAIGLEWLWRLMLQPKRWKRIFSATFLFLFKVVKNAILKP